MQREWMRQRYLSPAVFMILRMYDWDFILDTQNLFTFELKSYDELVREHNWKVKIPHNVTALQLEMLRWKLKGQCRGEFCKFNMLKG